MSNRKNLNQRTVFYNKNLITKEEDPYFIITSIPEEFGIGNNLVKINANKYNLVYNSKVDIEVVDSNKDIISHQVLTVLEQDLSRVISITIDEKTPMGKGVIYLYGEASKYPNGVRIDPSENNNILYTIPIYINPKIKTKSPILFKQIPEVTISEQIVGLTKYDNVVTSSYQSGSVEYRLVKDTPYVLGNGVEFNKDMEGGVLTLITTGSNPSYNNTETTFTSSIKEVLNKTTLILQDTYVTNESKHIFKKTSLSDYIIDYTSSLTDTKIHNSQSYAIIEIDNLTPGVGYIDTINILGKQKSDQVDNYKIINQSSVLPSTIYYDKTTNSINTNIGIIKDQDHINTYYELITNNNESTGSNTLILHNNQYLFNGIEIDNFDVISNGGYIGIKIKDDYERELKRGMYSIEFNLVGYKLSNDIGELYISLNTQDNKYSENRGIDICYITQQEDFKVHGKIKKEFYIKENITTTPIIWFRKGKFIISDINIKSSNIIPNFTRHIVPIELNQNNDLVDFKISFENPYGEKSITDIEMKELKWIGSNTYISDTNNVLDGRMTIGQTPSFGIYMNRDCVGGGEIKSPTFKSFDQNIEEEIGGFYIFHRSGSSTSGCEDYLTGSGYSSNSGMDIVTDGGNYIQARLHGTSSYIHMVLNENYDVYHNNKHVNTNSHTPVKQGEFNYRKRPFDTHICVIGRYYVDIGGASGEFGNFQLQHQRPSGSGSYTSFPSPEIFEFGNGIDVGANQQIDTCATFSIGALPTNENVLVEYYLNNTSPTPTNTIRAQDLIFIPCNISVAKYLQSKHPVKPDII